jgi:hypothetical protein
MRTEAEIHDRIEMSIVEAINKSNFAALKTEPENFIPMFVKTLADQLTEVTLDEITFRKR